MRLLAHNGEINTLLGNINWVKSRQQGPTVDLDPRFDTQKLQGPLVDVGRSDSANLDRLESISSLYIMKGDLDVDFPACWRAMCGLGSVRRRR